MSARAHPPGPAPPAPRPALPPLPGSALPGSAPLGSAPLGSPPHDHVPTGHAPSPAGLTREDVVLAFELLLGRAPETEAAITHHQALPDRVALGRAIRASAEFRRAAAAAAAASRPPGGAAPGGDCVTLARYSFGRDGDVAPHLRAGWSTPDPHSRWSTGIASRLELPLPQAGADGTPRGDLALTLTLMPFSPPQRLSLELEGTELAALQVQGPTVVGCRIPCALLDGRTSLHLTLHHPDATRPCDVGPSLDDRALGFAVEALELATLPAPAAPAEADAALLQRFESLGDNCEFGFVQRRLDRSGGGLLRFSGMPFDQLLRALANRFEGFPDRARLRLELHATRTGGLEAMVIEDGYRFITHTAVGDAALEGAAAEALLAREHARLGLLRRLLLEDLEGGDTIFVYRRRHPAPSEAEATALWLAIRRLGRGTLLWVAEAEPGHPAGSVTLLAEGFLKAHIDRLAPYDNAEAVSLDGWLAICRRAAALAGPAGTDAPGA